MQLATELPAHVERALGPRDQLRVMLLRVVEVLQIERELHQRAQDLLLVRVVFDEGQDFLVPLVGAGLVAAIGEQVGRAP